MSLHWPERAAQKISELFVTGGYDQSAPYAVVHPSSRWMFKAWRPEGNAEVIDYLVSEKKLQVVVTSSPDSGELDYLDRVLAATRSRVLNLAGKLDLPELAALINGAGMFFGVDSLPMHMAAAVNTPAVALFGPSGEHMWGPWGDGHQVLAKPYDCRPCGRDGCSGSKISRCLVEIQAKRSFPFWNGFWEPAVEHRLDQTKIYRLWRR